MIKKASTKRVLICIIMFCFVLISQNAVFAAQTLSLNYDGKTVKYTGVTYGINVNSREVMTDFPGIVLNKVTMLPIRTIFEYLGGKVTWNSNTQTMDIDYNGMKLQFKNNDANVKINGKNIKLSTPAKKINGRLIVPADFFRNIKVLSLVTDNKLKIIKISSLGTKKPVSTVKGVSLYYDGKNVKYTGINYKININDQEVKTDFPGIVFNKSIMLPLRAVFEELGGVVIWNSKTQIMDITYNGMKLQFKNNDANVKINEKTIKLSMPVKKINERLVVPIDLLKNIQDFSYVTDNKTQLITISSIGSIKEVLSETSEGKDIITLKVSNDKGFHSFRLTNPNRIVIDIKNVKTSEEAQTIITNLTLVKGIRIAAVDVNTARVVVDLVGMENFTVEEFNEGCRIIIQKPLNTKLSYENSFDRVYFSLQGIQLSNVSSTISKYYSEEYDTQNNKYTITIPSSSAISLAEETFYIDDELVNNIQIYRDKESSDTKVVFQTNKQFKFYITYNDKRRQSEINLLVPASDKERLVVIDAGHGGLDPGASKNTIYEKDLNLAIVLKLEKLLKEKNIKTFMLRQDDTFVGLYDRPYIANELNATLFLSIHNNANDNSKVTGTETLFFPETPGNTLFSGKKFASLVQDSLINTLGTVNRKTIERPGLVVLKYTKMPACLAEVAFISNSTDLMKLVDQSFQQKTAEALCDAIVKSLEQIELEKNATTTIELEKTQDPDVQPE